MNIGRRIKHIIILLLAIGLSSACLRERDRSAEVQALIEQTVEERLANYKRIRMERCRENIIKEANRIVDSLLIVEARREKDTLQRPPKPARPEKPELKTLDDTTKVKPLLPPEDTVERDSSGQ